MYNLNMKPAIEFRKVNISRNQQRTLSDVNFQIDTGHFVYIIGTNGSGKSTLIHALLGLTEIESGDIRIFGKLNTQDNVAAHIGYVPQYSGIDRNFPISVTEMIDLTCTKGSGCPTDAKGHLEFFNAGHLADRPIRNLSGGEFQKVLIARALVNNPDIVILDEPVNNLDQQSQKNLLHKLKELSQKQNKTIIIISHDHHLIEGEDYILSISEGSVKPLNGSIVEKTNHKHE